MEVGSECVNSAKAENELYGTCEKPALAFIVNPVAGSGRCEALFERAKAVFTEKGVKFECFFTEYHGHAEELAAGAVAKGFNAVIAVGGDGTVREAASALIETDIPLGILPFGTGNDFASALSIPTEPEAAAELILSGEARSTDLGRANGKVFTNVCGLGFDADVLARTEKHKKGRTGMLPYLLGILDAVLHKRKLHARFSLDGSAETQLDALIITACNGKRFGGGMLVAPEAKQDDGLFDICIAKYIGFFRLITLLPCFIKGKHIDKEPVTYTRAKRISVHTDGAETVQLDGELIEKTPLCCELIADAVRVFRP
ncbi:MAG: diacylglycerol kinase family lipid kinase [Clostridia bacterium]|nr:diacylglycerol kinase family lipid kinase [Clostridia bacterium]